jgi:hypothetical protein
MGPMLYAFCGCKDNTKFVKHNYYIRKIAPLTID